MLLDPPLTPAGSIVNQHHLAPGFAEHDRERIVALLREYESGIGVSLCFQNFAAELDGLPGDYAPPGGQMILAREAATDSLVGCVALRPVPGAADACEMKRLYVRSAARGSGLGRRLALAAMAEARRMGYCRICLDTLPSMTAAQALYRELGFRQTGIAASDPPTILFERALGDEA
jgi:ribosomal protein S18 acetylase RimI-like enzyme